MKRITAIILTLLLFVGLCTPMAGAVSHKEGMDALRAQFQHGSNVYLDYVYYSPVKSASAKKYPLVIWLHGNSSGDYPGHQLDNCNIAMWSSEEYQKRFKDTGGAFIFLPRCPTVALTLAWDGKQLQLKGAIDQFIAENKNFIDTDRIYIGGYSMGGKMAYIMPARYTGFFAAVFLLSPLYSPPDYELNALSKTPVWFAYCVNDNYPSLNSMTVSNNWKYLMSVSECPEKCRFSSFKGIYYPDGTYCGKDEVHNTWNAACYDFLMNDGSHYKDMTLFDGEGNTVTLSEPDGLISWLSEQNLQNETVEVKGFFARIIDAIISAFTNIIKIMGSIGGVL